MFRPEEKSSRKNMPDASGGLMGIVVFVVIVAVGVVLGITINEHLQSWIDSGSASTSPTSA